jgi:hypothetical protein
LTWDARQSAADGCHPVVVELDWYDGPRAGLVDIDGEPHYFRCADEDYSVPADRYLVWPAGEPAATLEREQWLIFVRWNERYEAGSAGVDRHPGHGGVDPRYDELTARLTPHRRAPDDARVLVAEWRSDGGDRYRPDGPGYRVRWRAAPAVT